MSALDPGPQKGPLLDPDPVHVDMAWLTSPWDPLDGHSPQSRVCGVLMGGPWGPPREAWNRPPFGGMAS
jgi:hypothetical protein